MLNQRLAAVHKVKASFLHAETLIDKASIAAARSLFDALEARAEANLPISTGQEAIDKLMAAVVATLGARNGFIAAHSEMAPVPSSIGLQPRMWGAEGDCPETVMPSMESTGLRSVA